MTSINSERKLQILYFSMKNKEIKNLKNSKKNGPISASIHTTVKALPRLAIISKKIKAISHDLSFKVFC